MCRTCVLSLLLLFVLAAVDPSSAMASPVDPTSKSPIYIAFLCHMHQPVYYPGETVLQTEAAAHFTFSVENVHTDRKGPYPTWLKDALQNLVKANLPHAGTHLSFTGPLVRNLNAVDGGRRQRVPELEESLAICGRAAHATQQRAPATWRFRSPCLPLSVPGT